MVLPTQAGSFPDEVIEAGKGGSPCDLFNGTYAVPIYLTNRDSMGQYNPSADQNIETVAGTVHGYWSNPAYWQGPAAQYVYYSGTTSESGGGDYLKQYTLFNGLMSTTPVAQSANIYPVGSTPSISASGTSNGILWAIERKDILSALPGTHAAVLYAYDATNVSHVLYNSAQNKQLRDQGGCANKFNVPTIANGKVYVGTQNELDVFGVLPTSQTTPQPAVSAPCFTYLAQTLGKASPPMVTTLTNIGPGSLTISSIAVTGSNASEFKQTNTCGTALAVGASCKISITFTASILTIPQVASVVISDNALGGAQSVALYGVATKK
jgi:hypothetical protein